ncbi:MAG: TonB family protein [Desulfobacter sp.]
MAAKGKPFNYLFWGIALLSLGSHILVLVHLSGIYRSRTVSYIELALHQTARSEQRRLPVPRMRQKALPVTAPSPQAVPREQVPLPAPTPVVAKVVVPAIPDQDVPALPRVPGLDASDLSVPGLAGPDAVPAALHDARMEFTSARDYLDMLNLRIHSTKTYPKPEKDRQVQGRVQVQFVLRADGSLSDIRIIKSSRYKNLDNAAVDAVKQASPFPRPPAFLFEPPVTLQISILFELA